MKNKTFGTIGETVFVPSLGGMRRSFQLLPATAQSDGSYSFQLPAQAAGLSRLAANDGGADPIADYRFDYYCGLISDYAEMTGAHFKIRFPSTTAVNDMTNLATYLEEAYNKFKPGSAFNFSYAARSSWPMCVEAKPLDAGVYGYYTSSKLGNNFGSMEFNTALLSDAAEMRVTVGHEFFHFVQSLYDPRNRFSKAVLESANYWVDEASAVWSEELFSDTPSTYISTVYAPNILEPTKGMQAGAPGNAAAHGYGMAPLIKYLVARKGNGYPLALYTSLSGGASAVDAVIANSPTPGDQIWVQDFLTEMLKGDCYKLSMGDLGVLAPASQRLDVKTAADVKASKAFTVKSPDLSGLVYMTVLNSAPLPANATLSHRLTVDNPQDFTLTVLKAKTGAATEVVATSDPVADGAIKLDIPNLASMQADGWRLLTLVTNKRRLSPYLGQTPMTLTMGVTSVPCSIPLTPYVAQPGNINDVPFPEINVSGAIVAGGLSDMTQWPGDGVGILVANALGEPPIDVQVNLSCDFKTATKDVPTGFGGYYDRYTISGPFKKFRLELMDVDPFNPVQTLESSGPSFHLVLDKDKKGFQFNVYAYYDVTVQTYSGDGIPSGSPLVFHDIYACVFIGDFIP